VAEALGLPPGTDALPPGDLPAERLARRLIAYLGTPDAGTETPDAWTGALMDHLIAERPDLALEVLRAGAALPEAGRLVDPLLDLAGRDGMDAAIDEGAERDADFARLVAAARDADGA
jgi:hypothetical protein